MTPERRYLPEPIEVRQEGDEPPKIVGRAAVFFDGTPDTEYQLFSDLKERIMPRAFNKALQERQDVRGLFNHDSNIVLGRTTSKTLRLSKSLRGLDYEIDPPDTQQARDLLVSIRRGDISGSSFGFFVREQRFTKDGDMDVREILSVDLLDVSPVTYPAYEATSASTRAMGDTAEVRAAYEAWKAEQREQDARDAEAKAQEEAAKAEADAALAKELAGRRQRVAKVLAEASGLENCAPTIVLPAHVTRSRLEATT